MVCCTSLLLTNKVIQFCFQFLSALYDQQHGLGYISVACLIQFGLCSSLLFLYEGDKRTVFGALGARFWAICKRT